MKYNKYSNRSNIAETYFDSIMSIGEKEYVINNIVKNPDFPLYYGESTSGAFPFFGHTLVERQLPPYSRTPKAISPAFGFFYNIFQRFCRKHNIEINYILRASINVTISHAESLCGEPHVDQPFPHKVFILYLNDLPFNSNNNATLLFDAKYRDKLNTSQPVSDIEEYKLNVIQEVYPEFGSAFCFDGAHYHTIKWPAAGDLRYICVINFA